MCFNVCIVNGHIPDTFPERAHPSDHKGRPIWNALGPKHHEGFWILPRADVRLIPHWI